MKALWLRFDANLDGALTDADFESPAQRRLWSELREEIDPNGDGKVRWDEFQASFRHRVMQSSLSYHNAAECTLSAAVSRVAAGATVGVDDRISKIEALWGFKEANAHTVDDRADIGNFDIKVGTVKVEYEAVAMIMTLFAQLDIDSSGGIDLADLIRRLRDKEKAESQFDVLFDSFDADKDGRVTLKEFTTKVVHHVARMPAEGVPADLTMEEQVACINTRLNRQIKSQCESLRHFFGL